MAKIKTWMRLLNFDGGPIQDGPVTGKFLTFRSVAISALVSPQADSKPGTPAKTPRTMDDITRRFSLARRIDEAFMSEAGTIDLPVEDVSFLKEAIFDAWRDNVTIVGQMLLILSGENTVGIIKEADRKVPDRDEA